MINKIKKLWKGLLKTFDEQCPNCGYYCTGKTIWCTKYRDFHDPVKSCEVHKEIGCAHVDGFLCDMQTCNILKE